MHFNSTVNVSEGGFENLSKLKSKDNKFSLGNTYEEMQNILGLPQTNKSDKLKEAFRNTFYNEETGLFCDDAELTHSALHSNVLPLFYGIATEEMNDRIVDFIMENKK